MKVLLKILLFAFFNTYLALNAQELSENKAKILAQEWMKGLKNNSSLETIEIKEIKTKKMKDEISLYVINFKNGGYVLIDGEEGDHPILSYSRSNAFNEEQLSESENIWINFVCQNIENNRRIKKAINLKGAKIKSSNAFDIQEIQTQFLVTNSSVPSLFETKQTSRWALWSPYSVRFPNQNGDMACVPLALAQIIKYYNFPAQGVGSHAGIDFSKEWFNYTQMPFRLTYCGNGASNCNEGSFEILPGISDVNAFEISNLIYRCGIAVDMYWNGIGTYGNPGNWVTAMSQHFNYSSGWSYYDEYYISANKELFKTKLRNDLNSGRPILFAYYGPYYEHGHAVVIDGYENDSYFHFAVGRGGYSDAYYYLFDYDSDGIHNQSPYFTYYEAVCGIYPNCSSSSIINLTDITVSIGMNEVYQSNDKINLSNFLVDSNGTSGGRITVQAQNEVNMGSGFEVKLGAEAFITMQKCGVP